MGEPLYCAQCSSRLMDKFYYEDTEIDSCMGCGGEWFDHGELTRVMRSQGQDPESLGDLFVPMETLSVLHRMGHCPRCPLSLRPATVGGAVQIRLQFCPGCRGIWLPGGEFERFLAHGPRGPAAGMEGPTSWGDWWFQVISGLPVEFNSPPRRYPAMTVGLIGLNIMIFCLQLVGELGPNGGGEQFGLVPRTFLDGTHPWSLLTHMFLHINLAHLIGNLYFLRILGDNVEDVMGRAGFLAFYLASGLTGGLLQVGLSTEMAMPVIGASGAISGVMAAYMILFRSAKLTFMFLFFQRKAGVVLYLGAWVVLQMIQALFNVAGVAWFAHIGGFVTGFTLTRMMRGHLVQSHGSMALFDRFQPPRE